jgi:hypothetical protein
MELDLSTCKKVTVASHAQRANELIGFGWKLLTTASGKDEEGYPLVSYSLGWFAEGEPREY